MKPDFIKRFFLFAAVILFIPSVYAQTPDEPIKIFAEEVHLNVTAQTAGGKFAATLKPDDLLVVEEGTPQKIESMKTIPASVLLVLDTGGNLNFAKTLAMTRLTAKLLVHHLSTENTVAVMQAYDKIEVVTDWTKNREKIQEDLDKKLFGGNRSRFADAINEAVEIFKSRPIENRHLVFIGDGLDSIADADERQKALQNLVAANITVHGIAYNKMEADGADGAARRFQIGEKNRTPRMPPHVLESIIQTLPTDMKDDFRKMAESERLIILRLDNKALKLARQKRESWIKSEAEMQILAEDTGGMFHAPEERETMWRFTAEVAAAIGSNYVITYIPTKSIADALPGENRKVRVSTHCDGVRIRSRHKFITPVNK